ncbi:PREDICTED: serine/threonine-protein kinase 17A-like [Rhagoletis zephyria]|uniref:serine/threonine-protein kinase 17A-like n=1 Tax=Rhagoletis zephyria TaxID=28612 RepID=UPI000811879B|nr:PREDICTED: serine/threonine-protein kinase 17A-like [Rhagoletis zephyria]
MPSSVVKEGLLTESNCAITEEQLNAIIRRGQQITDFYEQEKDCFARGKFAQVRRICHKETGIHYAAKSIKRRRPRCGDVTSEILHEIRVLLTSEHCNRVIDVHEVFETPTEYILVLELAKGGELQQILDEDERIEEKICRRLLRQIVEGVRFLHTHKIAHLDLKPQNILLTNPLPDGNVKLCDFGISRYISESAEIREIMGTTDYMAPEILQYDPISLASDIWCIGIVAYVLLSGHSPFGGNEKQETYSNITSGALEFPDSLFENVSEQAKDFIRRCLIRDPCERMTCDECLEHEWISNDDLKLEIITTSCEEVVVLTNNGVACDGESNKEEVNLYT